MCAGVGTRLQVYACVCVFLYIFERRSVCPPPHLQVLRGSGFEQSGSYYRSEALLICLQTLLLASLPLSRSPVHTVSVKEKKKNNSTAMKNRPAQLERRLRDSIALFPQSRAVADGILWRNYFTGASPPTGTGLSDEKRQVKNCIV